MRDPYSLEDVMRKFQLTARNTIANWEKGKGVKTPFPQRYRIGLKVFWDADAVDAWFDKSPRGLALQRGA